jgi:hypothetical protein
MAVHSAVDTSSSSMNGVRCFILLVFRPNISNGRSYSIQHARYTDMCPRASRRLMPFLDVVSWVRIPLGRDCGFCDYVLCGCRGPWNAQIRRHCRKSYGISKPIVGVTDQSRLQTTARMFATLTVFLSPPPPNCVFVPYPPPPSEATVSGAGHRGPGNGSYSDWPNWTALSSSEKALYGL